MNLVPDPRFKAVTEAAADPDASHSAELPPEIQRACHVMAGQTRGKQDIACDGIRDLRIPGPGVGGGARPYVPRTRAAKRCRD